MKTLMHIALLLLAGNASVLMAKQDGRISTAVDGNGLLPKCKAFLQVPDGPRDASQLPQLVEAIHCLGFVSGVLDTLELWEEVDAQLVTYCAGESVTTNQKDPRHR